MQNNSNETNIVNAPASNYAVAYKIGYRSALIDFLKESDKLSLDSKSEILSIVQNLSDHLEVK